MRRWLRLNVLMEGNGKQVNKRRKNFLGIEIQRTVRKQHGAFTYCIAGVASSTPTLNDVN
jgi:hypothetical protein